MSNRESSTDYLWSWFGVCSVLFLVVLAVSPLKDYFQEYKAHQKSYQALLLANAASQKDLMNAQEMDIAVRQIWAPALSNTVDRCVSCHLGVENPEMAAAEQPFLPHPPVPHSPNDFYRFGCAVCHRGQGRALSVSDAHGETGDWPSPILPLKYTEASCGVCHLGTEVPEAATLSKGRDLISEYNCSSCHKVGSEEEPESNRLALNGLSQKTTVEWLRRWLKDPVSLRPDTRMPEFRFQESEVEALIAFLWTREPLPETELLEGAIQEGDYDQGRRIFREARCISCHTVDGKGNGSAPELMRVGSKLSANWLFSFLRNPHTFQPETEMPRYNLSDEDLKHLSAYMMEEFVDFSDQPEPVPAPVHSPKLIAEGERLFQTYGCGGCHALDGTASDAKVGPELTGIGARTAEHLDFGLRDDLQRTVPEWLKAKIREPGSFRQGLKMPKFDFDEEELEAVVTALLSLTNQPPPPEFVLQSSEPFYEGPGRFGRMIEEYRCLSCHRVGGSGGDIAKADLTFEGSKVNRKWLKTYLLVPATIRPLLTDRMVSLKMTEEEASLMADFMSNVYVDNAIPDKIFEREVPAEVIDNGKRLYYEVYGCQACHMVDNQGGYYGPLLDGFDDRLKEGWIFWWLQGPQRWRGDVRCPDYGLEEEHARELTAFLVSMGSGQSRRLRGDR